MPTTVSCSFCSRINQVRSEFGGRSLVCQECGAEIRLPLDEPGKIEDFEEEVPVKTVAAVAQSSGASTVVWWVVGAGAVGLFLLLVGVGIVIAVAHAARQPQLAQRSALPAQIRDAPPVANDSSLSPAIESPPATARSDETARLPVAWSVRVDGLNEWVPLPPDHKVEVKIPRNSGADVLFPDVPSLFVAVGSNHSERDQREIWSIQSNQRVGTIQGVRIPSLKTALSADGNYFAALPLGATAIITLWDVKAGKPLPDLPFNPNGFVRTVAFAGNNRLMAVSGKNECTVWSIPAGKAERIIELSRYLETDSLAVSPGGRYLTFVDGEFRKRRVRSFDLTTGEESGELLLNGKDRGAHTCKTLQYSPDGRELAGIFDNGNKNVFLCWDVATGKLRTDFEFEEQVGVLGTRQHSKLQWFPDRSRWLLNGHFVLDRSAGKIVSSIGTDQLGQTEPCYVLDDRRVLQVFNDRGDRTLTSVLLPENAAGSQSTKQVESSSPTPEGAAAGTE